MQRTKTQILAFLKRHGYGTVDHLAEELGLAPMTIRQHLTALERDELVVASPERQRKGRPHFVYRLTDLGDATFPKHYDRLAAQLLRELGRVDPVQLLGLTPDQRASLLFSRMADQVIEAHATQLHGAPLDERVRAAAAILTDEGGFVEWAATPDGYEIRDYNCAYRALSTERPPSCAWHQRLIGGLTGAPVRTCPPEPGGGMCCRYIICCDRARALSAQPARSGQRIQDHKGKGNVCYEGAPPRRQRARQSFPP